MDDFSEDLTEPSSIEDELARSATRCAFFLKTFEAYNRKLHSIGFKSATMNKVLLGNCIESYFIDIRRLKAFHALPRANRFKRAGYTLKWFSRVRPIQVGNLANLPTHLQRRGILVNADFALANALTIVGADRNELNAHLVRDLLYTVHYRDLDGGVMAQLLEVIALRAPKSSQ